MNRKQVETNIISLLNRKVEELGFVFISEDYSSQFNHIIRYERRINHTTVGIDIRFMLPNYLKLQVQFWVYNDSINNFFSNECKLIEGWYPLLALNFDMEDYFSAINKVEKYGFYITDDGGYKSVDIEKTANKICERYFYHTVQCLIPQIDTTEKLESIINAEDNFKDDSLELSLYCYPIQNQILAGVALAEICKKTGYELVLKNYLSYCKKNFSKGEDEDIDYVVFFLESLN